MAPVASVWRRAWTRPRGGGPRDSDGGGGLLPLTAGGDSSSTSDTTYTTGTSSAASAGEWRPRGDLHPFTEEDKAKKLEHIKRLVDELHADDDASERWLSEMDVGWVLRLAALGTHEFLASVVTSHGLRLLVETWILALRKIGESILTSLDEGASKQPPASEFAELVQATVLKMLPFVDVVAAAKTGERRPDASAEKLQVLMDMHDALSMASQHILALLQLQVVESTDGATRNLLSVEMAKLDKAMWGTITEIMNTIIAWICTDDGGSSVVHKVTYSIASCSKVLWANQRSVNRVLHDAFLRGEYKAKNENASHVSNLIMEMICSLERKPFVTKPSSPASSSLGDSLRLLFLINNSYYLLQEFHTICPFDLPSLFLTRKIDGYVDSYLHESWAPALKCLQDPATPRCCFARHSSPVPKFVSKFQKTYAAQKAWKVPDPQMRRRLRKAVVDRVIPVFTASWENNSVSAPQITPRKAEKMLGELFEG